MAGHGQDKVTDDNPVGLGQLCLTIPGRIGRGRLWTGFGLRLHLPVRRTRAHALQHRAVTDQLDALYPLDLPGV
ncbi:hypothetical protein EV674_10585 [Simplicispira metamorpha]|uniref:Uncharacterized protein n=1 Tax=Simplicispira metamorpha TaxID=80881 RepID=A0A4R2NDX7_9BURK|nr:hypothetical protein EV674_10585 [Simplicispira metamorpha]